MRKFPPMPQKEPVVDKQGRITPAWVQFLQAFEQAIKELQEAVEELQGGP